MKTLRAQWLGQQLRELRERNGLTLKEAAEYLQRNFTALSRYELAEWPIRRGDVLALMDLYGVHDEQERRRLIELAEEVWRTDQWEYGDVVDRGFIDYPWRPAPSASARTTACTSLACCRPWSTPRR